MRVFKNNQYCRRKFNYHMLGGAITIGFSPGLLAQNNSYFNNEIDWYNAKDIGVEGKGWTKTKRYFDRLPSKAEGIVRNSVWELSRHSSGMSIRT